MTQLVASTGGFWAGVPELGNSSVPVVPVVSLISLVSPDSLLCATRQSIQPGAEFKASLGVGGNPPRPVTTKLLACAVDEQVWAI